MTEGRGEEGKESSSEEGACMGQRGRRRRRRRQDLELEVVDPLIVQLNLCDDPEPQVVGEDHAEGQVAVAIGEVGRVKLVLDAADGHAGVGRGEPPQHLEQVLWPVTNHRHSDLRGKRFRPGASQLVGVGGRRGEEGGGERFLSSPGRGCVRSRAKCSCSTR
eukprot:296037-Hanusia_phi.AAC.1